MGLGTIWDLHLSRLLQCPSKHGRPHLLRSVRVNKRLRHTRLTILLFSSTNLDSWSLAQLRTMKVGGNASAADFFTRHGGSHLLSNGDAKARYASSVAQKYKEELERRKRDDERKFPEGIVLEGVDLGAATGGKAATGSGTGTPAGGAEGGDDFFSTWDKPAASPAATSKPSTPSGVPGIGAGMARTTSAPRTVTSSALRSGGSTPGVIGGVRKPTATRLSSTGPSNTSTSTTPASAAPKASRLGAKKAAAPINFEEAQRKALEEEERIKRLGYDKKREEDEQRERERREAEARKAASASDSASRSSTPLGATRSAAPSQPKQPVRMGFGATVGAPVVVAAKSSG